MKEQVQIHDKEVLPTQGGFRMVWMTADPIEYGLLKDNARANRKNMTEAESTFWSLVKGNALILGPFQRKSRLCTN